MIKLAHFQVSHSLRMHQVGAGASREVLDHRRNRACRLVSTKPTIQTCLDRRNLGSEFRAHPENEFACNIFDSIIVVKSQCSEPLYSSCD